MTSKPYHGPVTAPAGEVRIGGEMKSYFEWPLELLLEEAGDRRGEFLSVLTMADQLSTHFGLTPKSRPVFISWGEALSPDFVRASRRRMRINTDPTPARELFGWTPREAPHEPHIALSEWRESAYSDIPDCWISRSEEKLLATCAHEFGKRLMLDPRTAPIVEAAGWELDLLDGNCSSKVIEFAAAIAKCWSGMVMLSDAWGRGYRDLAQKCRLKAGLSADPSVVELGMHRKFGLAVVR